MSYPASSGHASIRRQFGTRGLGNCSIPILRSLFKFRRYVRKGLTNMAAGYDSVDMITANALRLLGVTDDQIMQGWGSASASAGTHNAVGENPQGHTFGLCTDLSHDLLAAPCYDRLIALGIIPFERVPGANGWPSDAALHVHCVSGIGRVNYEGARCDLPGGDDTEAEVERQIEDWLSAPPRNGLVSHLPLPDPYRPDAAQQTFVRAQYHAWQPVIPVHVYAPGGAEIPCYASCAQDITRCEVAAFCGFFSVPLAWTNGRLLAQYQSAAVDLTSIVRIEGQHARAGLTELAGKLGMAIKSYSSGDGGFCAHVGLEYA